jgi:hypothetical protein
MANATTYHGERRFPVKKVSLFAFFEVKCEIQNSNPKKQKSTLNRISGFIETVKIETGVKYSSYFLGATNHSVLLQKIHLVVYLNYHKTGVQSLKKTDSLYPNSLSLQHTLTPKYDFSSRQWIDQDSLEAF